MPSGNSSSTRQLLIIKSSKKGIKKIFNFSPKLIVKGGCSDGNLLTEAGIPSVVYGVTGKGMHAENEYASVKSMRAITRAYCEVALDYLGVS